MKWIFIFLYILTSISFTEAQALPKHLVLDIDWTIIKEIKNITPELKNSKRVIEVQGVYYYVNEGLEEIIESALKKKDVLVSFDSGGSLARNHELLSKIKLKNGKSLRDIAFKILGSEDLTPVAGAPPEARFAERFKKDLTKISKDLSQLILLDDTADFVLTNTVDDQSKHSFYIGKAFEHFDDFEAAEKMTGEYVPKTDKEWLLDKKKLYILRGAFERAYDESKGGLMSFSEAMKRQEELLNLKEHAWNELSRSYLGKKALPSPIGAFHCEKLYQGLKLLGLPK